MAGLAQAQAQPQAVSGGFSLFPNTSSPPRPSSKIQTPRQRAASAETVTMMSPSSATRKVAARRNASVGDGNQRGSDEAVALTDLPPRCETSLSDAPTLVRKDTVRSRGSTVKQAMALTTAEPDRVPAQIHPIRSIFPQYNPELPLTQQDYYPQQAGPTHLPRSAVSRPLYSPTYFEANSPPLQGPIRSPPPTATAALPWPPARAGSEPVLPPVSSTEALRSLWKATHGWKASVSEGRLYCLRMIADRDAPVYTLSSADGQPFYSFRVDPTSASARVTLACYDPNRPFRGRALGLTAKADAKGWHEVLSTWLRPSPAVTGHQDDGLVAQLWPSAAVKLAAARVGRVSTVTLAERECGRLVWDSDSGAYYLAHPALATPFCVTVERYPALSKTEYSLEHIESPLHLARLTRDGTGAGWLEVDTGVAAKADAVYLIDVAVTALLLVAHADDKFARVEAFAPPPTPVLGPSPRETVFSLGRERRASPSSRREEKKAVKARIGQLDMDMESRASALDVVHVVDVVDDRGKTAKRHGLARGLLAVLTVIFRCFIWVATLAFKAVTACLKGLEGCLTSDKT